MQASTDRILTTHVGSLPRGDELLEMLVRRHDGKPVDEGHFRELVRTEMETSIRKQLEAGIDIVGDGELARLGFSFYVKDRLTGFGGTSSTGTLADFSNFPAYARLKRHSGSNPTNTDLGVNASLYELPAAVGRVAYDPELSAVREELNLFSEALAGVESAHELSETFITAASPGTVVTSLLLDEGNPEYATDAEYVLAVADALRHEYRYVVEQGHVLQLDAPDLAMERQLMYQDRPLSEFLDAVELHVEAINRAIADLPRDRVRLHVCWGNYDGPHVDDVELRSILPLLYEAEVGAIALPCGNPRHTHEHRVFRDHPLPDGTLLAVGVIDVTTNYVEHPQVVADRLISFAESVGDPTRIIASTDCGLSTFGGYLLVAEDVAWLKLRALADGASLATETLF